MMALQGHIDFAVFGDDYDTPDGTAIRDYIHVTDLAAAHVAALNLLETGHAGGSLNLGTGSGFSVRDILNASRQETGREVPHTVKPRRAGDPTYLVADVSAARKALNFVPRHSDLATVIRTAWTWHQKHTRSGNLRARIARYRPQTISRADPVLRQRRPTPLNIALAAEPQLAKAACKCAAQIALIGNFIESLALVLRLLSPTHSAGGPPGGLCAQQYKSTSHYGA